jgi:hypothetical protein
LKNRKINILLYYKQAWLKSNVLLEKILLHTLHEQVLLWARSEIELEFHEEYIGIGAVFTFKYRYINPGCRLPG